MNLHSVGNFAKTNYQISRYIAEASANAITKRKDSVQKRQRALEITAKYSSALLDNLNVKIETKLGDPNLFDRNYFMVCNHMSYFDILILSSVQPAVFVTSVEMEKTFFLGDMAKLGGSFFVDRVNRRKMKQEVAALVELLNQKFNVFIFPEGTSTNGLEILPFKKSLFRVPFQTGFSILPICLRYKSIDGEPLGPNNCDRVCWHGDMTFAPHLLQFMGLKEVVAEVQYLDPLDPKKFTDHGEISRAAESSIRQAYFGS